MRFFSLRSTLAAPSLCGVLLCFFLAACGSAAELFPTPLPTVTLVPPTDVPPAIILTETATPATLIDPSSLLQPTSVVEIAPLLASVEIESRWLEALISDLATHLKIAPSLVIYVSAEEIAGEFAPVCEVENLAGENDDPAYFLRFMVGTTLYAYRVQSEELFERCSNTQQADNEILLAADPIAGELVRMAQQLVATQLDLPMRRVQLVSVNVVIWQDSSLGCPRANQTYMPLELPGYRIVVQTGDTSYAFHSDAERLYACPSGSEQLPEATVEVTAEETATD